METVGSGGEITDTTDRCLAVDSSGLTCSGPIVAQCWETSMLLYFSDPKLILSFFYMRAPNSPSNCGITLFWRPILKSTTLTVKKHSKKPLSIFRNWLVTQANIPYVGKLIFLIYLILIYMQLSFSLFSTSYLPSLLYLTDLFCSPL